ASAVSEKAAAREISKELARLQKRAELVGGGISSQDLLNEVDGVSMAFDSREPVTQLLQPPSELLKKAVERLTELGEGNAPGAISGVAKLDEKIGPLPPGHLVIVAGRPVMGKTVLGVGYAIENN